MLNIFSERIHDWRFKCKICLPQKEKAEGDCAKRRSELISREREFWNLTIPLNPNNPNPDDELLMPLLDQSNPNVIIKTLFDKRNFTGLEFIMWHNSHLPLQHMCWNYWSDCLNTLKKFQVGFLENIYRSMIVATTIFIICLWKEFFA